MGDTEKPGLGWLKSALARVFRGPPEGPVASTPHTSEVLAERLTTQSERFIIVPLNTDDAPALRALTDHPAVTGAISFLRSPFTLEDAQSLIWANGTDRNCFMGVRRKADRMLVGVIGAHLREEKTIEIGYWVGPAYHRQGYATEAVGALIACAARTLPGRQIFAECTPENVSSVRVLGKLGFEPAGALGIRPGRIVFALRKTA